MTRPTGEDALDWFEAVDIFVLDPEQREFVRVLFTLTAELHYRSIEAHGTEEVDR